MAAGARVAPFVLPPPIVLFASAFATDLLFAISGDLGWAGASFWLLAGGVVAAGVALVFGLVDAATSAESGDERRRTAPGAAAFAIGLMNVWLRIDDSAQRALPFGVLLSAAAVLILVLGVWLHMSDKDRTASRRMGRH